MRKHTFVILAYKESDDLEECIKSVLKQSVKSNVLIATSTPNDYIMDLASKYSLGVMVNDNESNKGNDYNFALQTMNSELITIAHQDDLYNRNYTKEVIKMYKKINDATIIFTDNYEIKGDKKILNSKRLRYQRRFLLPLKFKLFQKSKIFKLRCLRREKFICTSSITFVKSKIKEDLFPTNYIYDNDWVGLIELAKTDARFVFVDEKLVGYRVVEKEESIEKLQEDEEILKANNSSRIFKKMMQKKLKN